MLKAKSKSVLNEQQSIFLKYHDNFFLPIMLERNVSILYPLVSVNICSMISMVLPHANVTRSSVKHRL
jgi:hypothetical protein